MPIAPEGKGPDSAKTSAFAGFCLWLYALFFLTSLAVFIANPLPASAQSIDTTLLSQTMGRQIIAQAFGVDPLTLATQADLGNFITSQGGNAAFSLALASNLNISGVNAAGILGAVTSDPLSVSTYLGSNLIPSLQTDGLSLTQISQLTSFNPDFTSVLSGFSGASGLTTLITNATNVDLGLQTIASAFGINSSLIATPTLLNNFIGSVGGVGSFSSTLSGVLNIPSLTASGITNALTSGLWSFPTILGSGISNILQSSGMSTSSILNMLSTNSSFGNEIIGGLSSGVFNFTGGLGGLGVNKGTTTFADLNSTGGSAGSGGAGAGGTLECADEYFVQDTGKTHMAIEMEEDRRWMFEDTFIGHVLPSMVLMTHQLTAVAMQQMLAIGGFIDAWTQLESQLLIQQLQAQAHKDYHPSEGICEIASAVRSLANSDRNREFNVSAFSQYMLERQAGQGDVSATEGRKEDRQGRVGQYVSTYCDPRDNNTAMGQLCDGTPSTRERRNKDLDYNRILIEPETLDVDFLDNATAPTPTEQDLFALSSNLFAPEVLTRIPRAYLKDPSSASFWGSSGSAGSFINPLQGDVLEAQSIVAKRSVAQNSINAIVGMKAEASMKFAPTEPDFPSDQKGAEPYLYAFLRDLGLGDSDIKEMIGENPSYYAYMGVLTKKIYQNPKFYVGLYDKPANVARKRVALKAIELMQDRDMLQSQLRTEAAMAVLLEMSVQDSQSAVANQEGNFTGEGQKVP